MDQLGHNDKDKRAILNRSKKPRRLTLCGGTRRPEESTARGFPLGGSPKSARRSNPNRDPERAVHDDEVQSLLRSLTVLTTPNVVAACRLRSPAFCVVAFLSSVLFSGVLTAFCVILIIDPATDKPHRIENAVELAFALGWLCLSINQANTFIGYSFLIFAEGFTQRRRQAEGEIVPWSQVVTLLPRPLLQRLDLRGAHGRLLATVEYQIDGLERAFVEIVKRRIHRRRTCPSRCAAAGRLREL